MNPLYEIDFYKIGHAAQYPEDTEQVWSNWTARSSRVPGQNSVKWCGLQPALVDLQENWSKGFFGHCWPDIQDEYEVFLKATMGRANPKVDHIRRLWELDYLPLDIWALPEGTDVPLGVPMMVITNTHPWAYWLPNYLETYFSNKLWKMTTSATTAHRFREIFLKYAKAFGEQDLSFVDWQGHDFSYRGMSGLEDAVLSGLGHLLSFNGSDTIPAIRQARHYYAADIGCGGSVDATEHSVMCAGGQDGEFETFKRLITQTYPSGIVSIVSDTWDLWRVLTDYIPRLKKEILARNGKVVIRPDSGDPVKIMLGNKDAEPYGPEWHGALHLLRAAMGTDGQGHINNAGLIYGDGITEERAEQILAGCVAMGLSPYNVVLGIGSFTYTYCTRDTYGFAMKATAVRRAGVIHDIFKKPVTNEGSFSKVSLKGIPVVYREDGLLKVKDGQRPEDLDNKACAYQKVFSNGRLLVRENFETIRKRVRS